MDSVQNNLFGIKTSRDRRLAFGWYGGKFSHLSWLLPLLPITQHYCEPFGGSGSVLINRQPSPVETFNDVDGEIVNFFEQLRDNPDELIRILKFSPFSREEFNKAINNGAEQNDMERARLFFVKARQVRTGLAQTASNGRWAYCKNTSRRNMSGSVSRWLNSIEGLTEIAERFLMVQIENDDATAVIKRYDSPDTLFYCDPPYPHSSRGDSKAYGFEMSDEEHIELASIISGVLGKVAISGYRCDLMDELYGDWRREEAPVKNCHSIKKKRQEILWLNFE